MEYRREIDGLRAVAVLSVLLHHAKFNLFSGGFVGVDVFFVISGYLITSILINDIQSGSYSLRTFYERRARRILPALFVVVAFCLPPAWTLMQPEELRDFARSVVAVALFLANVFFWRETSYFGPEASETPLVHTWSLAVEEQFYVLYPLLLFVCWRFARHRTGLLLVAAAVAGVTISEIAAHISPSANFYLLPTRAFELLIGASASYFGADRSVRKCLATELAAAGGLAAIAYSIVFFGEDTVFPGVRALLPTIGTALIVLYAAPGSGTARLLSNRAFVGIGLISYSAYLWHQPIFAFARIYNLAELTEIEAATLILLTLVLAWLSWKYVEQPFRNRRLLSRRSVVVSAAAAWSLALLAGSSIDYGNGFADRLGPVQRAALETAEFSPLRTMCHSRPEKPIQPGDACVYFASVAPTWAVFGDSHAVEFAYALGQSLEQRGESLVHLSFSGCPPALQFTPLLDGQPYTPCQRWIERSMAYLETHPTIEKVVLVFRHGYYLFGDNRAYLSRLPDETPRLAEGSGKAEKRALYLQSMQTMVHGLIASGKDVHLLLPIPEIALDVRRLIWLRRASSDFESFGIDYYERRNSLVLDWVRRLEAQVKLIDPTRIVCPTGRCLPVVDGKALYFDDNHLSLIGARRVVATMFEADKLSRGGRATSAAQQEAGFALRRDRADAPP